jgi:transposase-like protein
VRPYQGHRSGSWRVDETYVRVGGRWRYLFRAVDKHGRLIASMLSSRRDTGAVYRFLRKALRVVSDYPPSFDHDRQTGILSEGHPTLAGRRAAATGCRTPHLEISE